jgi:hypothetical protein
VDIAEVAAAQMMLRSFHFLSKRSRRPKSAWSIAVQPPMKVLAHERIIGKIAVLPADALYLGSLTGAEPFVRI